MHILRCYCTKGRKKRKKIKAGIALILCGALVLFLLADSFVRSVISNYPMTVATGKMTEFMDKAIDNVLANNNLNPSAVDIVKYDENGQVLSVETNTTELTKIKTAFTDELKKMLLVQGDILKVSIPIGTLIGHEYTLGRGPRITFNLQYSYTVNTNLSSTFYEAGVNNTLHSIELNVTGEINIIIPFGYSSSKVNTKYIVAETVIIGKVPDAYTGVYGADDDVIENIFDHEAKTE